MQSDWARAFLHLTQEPDFSQTCGFNRIIKVIMLHDLNPKNLHNGFFFCKIQKALILGCFWTLFPKWNFSQKSGSVSFLPLMHRNFMRSFRKILWAILDKTCLPTDILTYRQWWNHRTTFCLKAGVQKQTPQVETYLGPWQTCNMECFAKIVQS